MEKHCQHARKDRGNGGVKNSSGRDVHIIIFPELFSRPFALRDCLASISEQNIPSVITLFYVEATAAATVCSEAVKLRFPDARLEFKPIGALAEWPQAANDCLQRHGAASFSLFMSPHTRLQRGCLENLISTLTKSPHLVGVNPLSLDATSGLVSHLGTVADSQMRLHALYEGVSADSPLIAKERLFQVADPACLLVHGRDLLAAGGVPPLGDIPPLMALCLKLGRTTGKSFSTCAQALATTERRLESVYEHGMWNSWCLRGKIAPGTLLPDYAPAVVADGLDYGVTEWLNEGLANADAIIPRGEWLRWRHDPSPGSLLGWLASLERRALRNALSVCQRLPACLPMQFQYYLARLKKLEAYAAANGLATMGDQLAQWRRKNKSFHYGKLIPGMRALLDAGLYNESLEACPSAYDAWLELNNAGAASAAKTPEDNNSENSPLISVVMPVYNAPENFLREAIQSVVKQTYPRWELILVDDLSPLEITRDILREYAATDTRIKTVFRAKNGHISQATNTGIEAASGSWVAFMDQDDLLAPEALQEIARAIAGNNNLRLIYTDEDCITPDGVRRSPSFRIQPDRYLRGHLFAYHRDILRDVGLRTECDGSQDCDLNVRITQKLADSHIHHIPRIMYHWRIHENSTAGTIASKPYVVEAMRRTVEDDGRSRYGAGASVCQDRRSVFNFRCDIQNGSLGAFVVLATKGLNPALVKLLQAKAASLPCYIVANRDSLPDSANIADNVTLIETGRKNWYNIFYDVAKAVEYPYLLFMDGLLEPLEWCEPEQLLYVLNDNSVCAVGGNFWDGDWVIDGGQYPNVDGRPFSISGTHIFLLMQHYALAPSWQCAAMRKSSLLEQDGWNPLLGEYALTDFCLKHILNGEYVLISPWGRWNKTGSSEQPSEDEEKAFLSKWGDYVAANGLRNANLERGPGNLWKLRWPDSKNDKRVKM